MMAQYSEILNALEHITNEFITVDDRGRVATMRYSKPNADVVEESTLLDEFDYFQNFLILKKKDLLIAGVILSREKFFWNLL